MIDYIFYTIVSLGCSFLVYCLLLKNQKTFRFNRFYLLISLSLCLLAPILEVPTFEAMPSITEISLQPNEVQPISEEIIESEVVAEVQTSNLTFIAILWYLYLAICLIFIFRFIKNLAGITILTRQKHLKIGNLKLIETRDHKNASSFFNFIFINAETLSDNNYFNSVIQHERIHSKDWHTLDVIFMELLLCIFWFNPFVWFYKQAIFQNHEFIADYATVQSGVHLEEYSQSIIKSGHKEYRVPLTSGFNFIQIKNRIIMLHQSKSSFLERTLKITSVILLFTCIFMFSCTNKDINNEPLVVVIDAGHGGNDSGNLSSNNEEKQIVLKISNALAALSDEKVKIIQTRTNDETLSLKSRVEFVTNKQPDLFLSLHTNASQNPSANGVEAYFDLDSEHVENSFMFAEILVENQLNHFESRGVKTANLYLLKNITTVPGVLLELGFLTNDKDRAILTDETKQLEIARSIYNALLEIRN